MLQVTGIMMQTKMIMKKLNIFINIFKIYRQKINKE